MVFAIGWIVHSISCCESYACVKLWVRSWLCPECCVFSKKFTESASKNGEKRSLKLAYSYTWRFKGVVVKQLLSLAIKSKVNLLLWKLEVRKQRQLKFTITKHPFFEMKGIITFFILSVDHNINPFTYWVWASNCRIFLDDWIAGLMGQYLASGAQVTRINTWLGHSRLGLDWFEFLSNSEFNWKHLVYRLDWKFRYPHVSFENWANNPWESHLFPNQYVLWGCCVCRNWRWLSCSHIVALSNVSCISYVKALFFVECYMNAKIYMLKISLWKQKNRNFHFHFGFSMKSVFKGCYLDAFCP